MMLEVAADVGGMWQESVQNVSTGMAGLGAQELADTTQQAADAMDVMVGSMQIVGGIVTIIQSLNAAAAVKAVTGTVLNSTNPIGWGRIALATGAAAIAAAVTFPIVRNYRLKANLESPSDVQGLVQTLGVIV